MVTTTQVSLIQPTVGIDFLSRSFAYKGRVYRLQLWDTAGQEKYRSLVPAYLRDANCAVFVFDLSRLETLDNLKNWLQLYRDHQPETSIGMLVGNKSDLMVNVPADMEERIDTFAKHEGLHYWKVSAKEGNGITDLFRAIVELLFDSSPNQKGELGMGNQFVLQERQQKIKDPIGCCHI